MFTIADLQVALRRSIDPADQDYYQFLISQVQAFIEGETGLAFTLRSNTTVRYRADGWGVIKLVGPVHDVLSITPRVQGNYPYRYDGWDWQGSDWDGLDEITGLAPYEVVDVTYTFGYDTPDVPTDIKNAAINAVKNVVSPGPGELDTRTVGDITYKYHFSENDFDDMGVRVLNLYRGVARTWRL